MSEGYLSPASVQPISAAASRYTARSVITGRITTNRFDLHTTDLEALGLLFMRCEALTDSNSDERR